MSADLTPAGDAAVRLALTVAELQSEVARLHAGITLALETTHWDRPYVHEWQHVYYTDNVRSRSRKNAIQRGWRNLGHDDFLLARLDGDRLLGMAWQYEDRDPEDDESDDVAAQCGWVR